MLFVSVGWLRSFNYMSFVSAKTIRLSNVILPIDTSSAFVDPFEVNFVQCYWLKISFVGASFTSQDCKRSLRQWTLWRVKLFKTACNHN